MLAIYKRELKAYFCSPIGYIFLAIIYLFGGQYFSEIMMSGVSRIDYVFSGLFSIVLTIIPLITMRLMSEDKKLKTDQLLLTAPIRLSGIVIGKYLAAFTMYIIGIASTIIYTIVLATFTPINWNIFIGNFAALALMGGALIAIGLFISCLTENQVVAAMGGFAAMLIVFLLDTLAQVAPSELLKTIFTKLSFMSRYQDLIDGILNVSHIIFFVSIIAAFIYLTVKILDRKRWS